MDISFRDLVDILGVNAPVHFTPKEKLNKQNYVFCKFMGDEESTAIIAGNHDPNTNYDSSDIGLHFPDLGLEEYYELEKSRNPVGISTHICEISSQMIINIEDIPIVFAVHCVLHEYGHWLYFNETGLTSYEYCEQEKKERQPYENTAREIYCIHRTECAGRPLTVVHVHRSNGAAFSLRWCAVAATATAQYIYSAIPFRFLIVSPSIRMI